VEEDSHGVRDAQHEDRSIEPAAWATALTTRQTRSAPAVMGRRIRPPLVSWIVMWSAESRDGPSESEATRTGTKAEARGEVAPGRVECEASRRFQAWNEAGETPSRWQNW
jgi:hypothetical protein